MEHIQITAQAVAEALTIEREKHQAATERMRRWIYATARSLAESGLSLEEYNAITREVCDGFVPNKQPH